jgi:glucose-1-phosphate cytidylyltransferase
MQVVIFCGGLGTRLREETEFRPKPMVNIGTRPILWHIMKRYAHFGHKEFVLCLGYKGEIIKEYFYNYELMNNDFSIELGKENSYTVHDKHGEGGWKITLADTGEKALKGARIKKIEKYIQGDTFMLTYGDTVADIDINKLLEFHTHHGKMVTLSGVNPASRFGEMKIAGDKVISYHEKPEKANTYINGGFFVINRKIFKYLNTNDNCDLEIGPLDEISRKGELMMYKHPGSWACMDTLRDMDYLNNLWNSGKAFWRCW